MGCFGFDVFFETRPQGFGFFAPIHAISSRCLRICSPEMRRILFWSHFPCRHVTPPGLKMLSEVNRRCHRTFERVSSSSLRFSKEEISSEGGSSSAMETLSARQYSQNGSAKRLMRIRHCAGIFHAGGLIGILGAGLGFFARQDKLHPGAVDDRALRVEYKGGSHLRLAYSNFFSSALASRMWPNWRVLQFHPGTHSRGVRSTPSR